MGCHSNCPARGSMEPQTWSHVLPTSRASQGTRLENRQMHICGEQTCVHVYMCAKPEPTELCLLPDPRVQPKAAAPLATKHVQTAADQASRRQSIRAVVLQEPSGVVPEREGTTTGPEGKPGHALASETANMGSPRKPTKPAPGLSKDDPRNHKEVNLSVAGQGSNECSVSHPTKC